MLQQTLVFTLFMKCCICAGLLQKFNKDLEHESSFSPEYKYLAVKYQPNSMDMQGSDYELPHALNLRNDSIDDIINKTFENKTAATEKLIGHSSIDDITKKTLENTTFVTLKPMINDSIDDVSNKTFKNKTVATEKLIGNNSIDDIIKKTLENTTFVTLKPMINDSIDDVINKTIENKTLVTVPPIIPICELGDGNCTHCKEISMFCHYMYSEKRCVYYNSRHVSRLYECGEKWAEADENWEVTVSAMALLIVTFAAGGFIIWLRWRITTPEYIEEEDMRQMIETRLAVGRIREKYSSSRLFFEED